MASPRLENTCQCEYSVLKSTRTLKKYLSDVLDVTRIPSAGIPKDPYSHLSNVELEDRKSFFPAYISRFFSSGVLYCTQYYHHVTMRVITCYSPASNVSLSKMRKRESPTSAKNSVTISKVTSVGGSSSLQGR
jgi:hypothetical protein